LSCNIDGVIRTDQDALTINLDTCLNLTSNVDSVAIEYRAPDLTTGIWTASVTNTTEVEYTFSDDEFLSQSGDWLVKARINFTGGTSSSGTVQTITVKDAWSE
jgi:hypothetical protein